MNEAKTNVYHNGKTYAVTHGRLVLVGKNLVGPEERSKIFYSDYSLKRFLEDNGYEKIGFENLK